MDKYKVVNISPTPKDSSADFIYSNMQWIISSLNLKSSDEIVRMATPDWMNDFMMIAFKKLHFPNNAGIVNNKIDSVALAMGEKIESVKTKVGFEYNLMEFYQARKSGEWYVNSSEYLVCIKFCGIERPIIVYRQPFAVNSQLTERTEILMSAMFAEEFINFLQDVEKQSGRITVHVCGQKMYNIKPIEWDKLTLDESIDFLIRKDLDLFLGRRQWFAEKCIPYRRGYLLHGPPGNGKTTIIRAMLTHAKMPAFTIKKLYDQDSVYYFEDMFEAASRTGGAFIILEDIDRTFAEKSESNESNRNAVPFSMFLNCLDGIAETDGIILIATANNPQVLDKAILERPGRFDRVVGFPNPNTILRAKYFRGMIGNDVMPIDNLVAKCDNMSFAQLREIYILGTQIAMESGKDVTEKDLIEGRDRMVMYMKKAGVKNATGFKE